MTINLKELLSHIPRRILTPRLDITLLNMDDSDELSAELTGHSWDAMHKWVGWVDKRENLARTQHLDIAAKNIKKFENGLAYFGVSRLRSTGELGPQVTLYNMDQDKKIGECGYWTPTGLTGQKLTQEGMTAILRLAYEHYKLTEVFAAHGQGNVASGKVLTKLGFAFTHIEKDAAVRGNGKKIDEVHYRHNNPATLPQLDVEYL